MDAVPLSTWTPDPRLYWITPIILAMRAGDPYAGQVAEGMCRCAELAELMLPLLTAPVNPGPCDRIYWLAPVVLAMRSGDRLASAVLSGLAPYPELSAILQPLIAQPRPPVRPGEWVPRLAV